MMSKDLFEEFEEVTAKQWKQKIQFDLKGADYNETLVWKSPDGIDVKPFYHYEEAADPVTVNSPDRWNVVDQIYVSSEIRANKKARTALEKGAESLWFIIPSETVKLQELFQEIDLERTGIYIQTNFLSADFLSRLKKFSIPGSQMYLQMDIIGNLARTGNWFQDLKKDHAILDNILEHPGDLNSLISIDSSLYQNAGANIPQELAYSMAHLNEYLNHFRATGKNLEEMSKKAIQFIVAIGPNYFFEIAKIRAMRLLFSTLTQEYDMREECHILTQPTRRNKTLYDFNVNLLRTTTECMSAILGGANAVCNMAYDALYHKNNSFGNRIARNQLLILKHESYFEKVSNPAEGSYYIESLTQQFAEKALAIFKEIEKGGGFLNQLKQGTIQKKISESAAKEQELFDSGRLVLIGSNSYPNPEDKMKDELELYPFLKHKPRKTLLQPILERRLAEKMEQERLEKEG